MNTRFLRGIVWGSLTFASIGCGGAPPAQAPLAPPPSKPVAFAETPPVDLAPVPRPDSLIVFARITKPVEVLRVLGTWTNLPMPGAEAAGELLAGDSIGRVIDLSYPIDVAVAISGSLRSPRPVIAVSAGVRSIDDAKAVLGDKFKLVPSSNGAFRIVPSGNDDDDDRPCSLVPSFGAAATRIICADGPSAMESLVPYLARTAPRENVTSDVHAEVLLAPVRPLVQQFRAFLPGLVGGMTSLRMDSAGEALEAGVGDVADLTNDLDKIAIDLNVADAAAGATITSTFSGSTSLLARLAVAHPERADVPPSAFWHLPADADAAFFQRGFDEKDIAHPIELFGGLLVGLSEKEGMSPADRKALADGAVHALGLFSGPMVAAKGVDPAIVAHLAAVAASATPGKVGDRREVDPIVQRTLGGWSVVGVDAPIAKIEPVLREWVNLFNRPSLIKWVKATVPSPGITSAPTLKLTPAVKGAQLPAGSLHAVLTIPQIAFEDANAAPPPSRPGQKPATASKAKPTAPAVPAVIHAFAVPDAGHTWLVYAADEALAVSKARAVLSGAPETGTLAKRGDMDELRDSRANAAGFLSARGLAASSPLPIALGLVHRWQSLVFEWLQATPGHGATPLPFTMRAVPADGAGAGTLVITAKVPRAAIQDIVKARMLSGTL